MARKDFESYYEKIKKQYFQLVNTIEETNALVQEKAVDPEIISRLTSMLEPVKNSYMGLAYVEYLLNLPKDKKVRARNQRQFEAQLKKIDKQQTEKAVINKNQNTINQVKQTIEEEFR